MTASDSKHAYTIEYLRALFDLIGDDMEGMAYWVMFMSISIEEARFDECQQLIRFIKGQALSPPATGHVHLAVGDMHHQRQDWEAALRSYQQALAVFREHGSQEDEAIALNNMALALQSQSRYQEAREQHDLAATIYHALGNLKGLGRALSNAGSAAFEGGDWRGAIQYFQHGAEVLTQVMERTEVASVYNNLGAAYERSGDLVAAERYYLQCVDLLDDAGESYSAEGVRVLNNLGEVYASQMQWQQAVGCLRAALDVCSSIEDLRGEAATWNNLGKIYTAQQEHRQAAECYRRSVELHHQLDDRQGEAVALNSLGAAYADLGELALAETCYRNSLALSEELGETWGIARAYNNLGVLYEKRGVYPDALVCYKQCLALVHRASDIHHETRTLVNIAALYELMLLPQEATPYFEQAWTLAEAHAYNDHLMALCLLKGEAGLHLQRYDQATYAWYAQACQYARRANPHALDGVVRRILHHLENMQQRGWQFAAQSFSEALLSMGMSDELRQQKPQFVDQLQHLAGRL